MSKLLEIRERLIDALDLKSKGPGLGPDDVTTLVQLLRLEIKTPEEAEPQDSLTPESVDAAIAALRGLRR